MKKRFAGRFAARLPIPSSDHPCRRASWFDGQDEMDTNFVENLISPLNLTKKKALERIAAGRPTSRIHEPLHWNFGARAGNR